MPSVEVIKANLGDAGEKFEEAAFLPVSFFSEVAGKRFYGKPEGGREALEGVIGARFGCCVGFAIEDEGEDSVMVFLIKRLEIFDLLVDPF